MSARYLIRLDDITPTMDWERFDAILALLLRKRVKPLLGIVPDNRDPKLCIRPERHSFWEEMRSLQESGAVEFAQHGYQHLLTPCPGSQIIGPRYGIKEMSEFAGRSFNEQLSKVRVGQALLEARGITTRYWMAPNHSFDHNTLKALQLCGFTALTDGVSLTPFTTNGLVFIPQQLWRPQWMPYGVITICLHTNEMKTTHVKALRAFLRRPFTFSTFSEEVHRSHLTQRTLPGANGAFRFLYAGARRLKKRARRASANDSSGAVLGCT
jgi:predicted deacetylase